ncbi:MAG: LysR family transcriptional regulator [Archangiaceae bacterium]|nr:LysR family transcriptional regulator [Archangiaceae bacterium]
MDRIDDLRLFVRIIETGSLSAAARDASTTQPTVSKRLRALETAVGARLLNRNTRHVVPTPTGLAWYQHGKKWLGELDALKLELRPGPDRIAGPIRVNTAVTFGLCVLTPIAARFQRLHPEVSFHLEATDRRVDLVQDRVDLAVRIGGVGNPDLIATPLGAYGFTVVASTRWAREHPRVRTLAALQNVPVSTYDSAPTERLEGPGGPVVIRKNTAVDMNSSLGLRQLALGDHGPVLVARFVVHEDLERGDLVELVPGAFSRPLPTFAVMLPVRPIPQRLRAFLAYLKRELPGVPGWVPP